MTDCLYICSAGHSGSTLLDLLIGSHSRVASLGEISHLPKNISLDTTCTCGASVRSCPIWRQVIADLDTQLDTDIMDSPYQLDLGPFQAKVVIDKSRQTRLFLLGQAIIKAYWYAELRFGQNFLPFITSQVKTGIRNNFLLYDAVGKILNVDKVVDSSKSYLKAAELYRHHPDRVKILLLVRDGRAVFYSGLKNGFRRRRCVNVWRNAYTRAMPLLDRVVDPKDILWVHYENLAKDPENELRRVCEFATLEYQPDMLKFMEHDHHITNGNNMRFGTDSSIRFDESWRKGLTAKDAKYFNDRAKALNLSFGYE